MKRFEFHLNGLINHRYIVDLKPERMKRLRTVNIVWWTIKLEFVLQSKEEKFGEKVKARLTFSLSRCWCERSKLQVFNLDAARFKHLRTAAKLNSSLYCKMSRNDCCHRCCKASSESQHGAFSRTQCTTKRSPCRKRFVYVHWLSNLQLFEAIA